MPTDSGLPSSSAPWFQRAVVKVQGSLELERTHLPSSPHSYSQKRTKKAGIRFTC
jgi:hypothetical protein